jgi:hypothetical protein
MALATNALTMISTVETELSLTADAQDAELTRYIDTASDQIERYVNRKLYYGAAIVEKVAGSGDAFLWISRTPLSSITSVVWLGDDSTVTSSTYEIWEADQGNLYRSGGWNNTKISSNDYTRYQVTYIGGWITPQQDADDGALTRDLPWDLETACISMVVGLWRQKGADRTIRSESVLNTSVHYERHDGGIDPSVRAILDTYKRMDRLEMVG